MKAIVVERFGGPEELVLREAPDPVPGPGGVLVRVEAAGVNPVEAYVRSGAYPRKPALPYVPGSDAAGVVEAVGPGVAGLKAGDRVYAFGAHTGAYAQRLVAPVAQVRRLPGGVSFAQGAALGVPYATAHVALFHRGGARGGERVLVHGASGGVGLAAVQMARAAGLVVHGSSSSPEGRAELEREGCVRVFDHSVAGAFEAAAAECGGYDLILEMLANVNLARDLEGLRIRGRVVVVGSRGRVEIDPRAAMTRDADVRGMTLFNAGNDLLEAVHDQLVAGLGTGVLRPRVAAEMPLGDAPKAHAAVMGNGKVGKLVLLP